MVKIGAFVAIFVSAAFAFSMLGYQRAVRRPDEVVEVRLRRLTVPVEEGKEEDAKEAAEEAAKALREGGSFEEVAEEAGDAFAAQTGGDTGYFRRGQLEEELEGSAFSAPLQQVQGPIKTESGYVVFIVVAKRMRY